MPSITPLIGVWSLEFRTEKMIVRVYVSTVSIAVHDKFLLCTTASDANLAL